jgi:hypothetical protein
MEWFASGRYCIGDKKRKQEISNCDSFDFVPIPSRFNHSIKDWQYRQMWLLFYALI